jgi:hypothetical protein
MIVVIWGQPEVVIDSNRFCNQNRVNVASGLFSGQRYVLVGI